MIASLLTLVIGASSVNVQFSPKIQGRVLGQGKDYRVQSEPFAVTPGSWLQVGAKVRVAAGSGGKIACIGYLSWRDAAGKGTGRSGFGNVGDPRAGQSGPWRVIEDVIQVPAHAARAVLDLSSRSFSGRVQAARAWCLRMAPIGVLPPVSGPVVAGRVPGWLGDYEAVAASEHRVVLKASPKGRVCSAPFRWDRTHGRTLRVRLADEQGASGVSIQLCQRNDPTGRDIHREGLRPSRTGPVLTQDNLRPRPGAAWACLVFVARAAPVIADVEFTTPERIRREIEKTHEPVRESLINGGFEQLGPNGQPVGWRGLFRPIRTGPGREGKRGLLLATLGTDTEEVLSDFFRVEPGARIEISFSYRVETFSGGVSAFSPTIKWHQLPAERFALGGAYLANVRQTGQWVELRKAVSVPTTPRPVFYARIQLKNDRSRCRVLVDNVQVRLIPKTSP
jgi:hypothetical protein